MLEITQQIISKQYGFSQVKKLVYKMELIKGSGKAFMFFISTLRDFKYFFFIVILQENTRVFIIGRCLLHSQVGKDTKCLIS